MFSGLEHHKTVVSGNREPLWGIDAVRTGCDNGRILQTGSLPEETRTRRRVALLVSACTETSALAVTCGYETVCAILLLSGAFGIAWIYHLESQTPDAKMRRSRGVEFVVKALVALTCMIVVLLFVSRSHNRSLARIPTPKSVGPIANGTHGGHDDSYVSVVLWPKQPHPVRVAAPPPQSRPKVVMKLSKPLVIPFEGAYWYLRSREIKPGRNAHVVHGSPTKVNIHSTDWHPLMMEAHQRLSSPIDTGCCRELDLSILNADNRPGTIRIAVELIDSSSTGVESEDLEARPVISSMRPEFSLDRPPANEVLKYPIPTDSTIHHFNEIEVIFLPSKERSLGGVQIAIRNFRLLPSR